MKLSFEEISSEKSINDFIDFYYKFHKENGSVYIQDIQKKCNVGSSFQLLGFLAYNDSEEVVGAMACYPFPLSYFRIQYKAVQIGDAMVLKDYIDKDVFKELLQLLIARVKQDDFKFLSAFPSIQNYGVYRTFVDNEFNQVGTLPMFIFQISESRFDKLVSKVFPGIFKKRWKKFLKNNKIENPIDHGQYLSKRTSEFLQLKTHSDSAILQFDAGIAWVSVRNLTLIVGDFILNDNGEFEGLLKELKSLAQSLGKVQIKFVTNIPHEFKAIRDAGYFEQNRNMAIMINQLDHSMSPLYLFNYVDLDTF